MYSVRFLPFTLMKLQLVQRELPQSTQPEAEGVYPG